MPRHVSYNGEVRVQRRQVIFFFFKDNSHTIDAFGSRSLQNKKSYIGRCVLRAKKNNTVVYAKLFQTQKINTCFTFTTKSGLVLTALYAIGELSKITFPHKLKLFHTTRPQLWFGCKSC